MKARGAVLMELMLSLALFVTAGLAILTLVRQSMSSLEHTRRVREAADIARSAIARIEAGIDRPDALVGPAALWDGRSAAMSASTFDEGEIMAGLVPEATVDPVWELEIESSSSSFAGLNEVSVRALRRAAPGSERIVASFTLTQLVRLSSREADVVGDEGDLVEEAIRGAREGGR